VGIAWFRFYAELNDLVPKERRGRQTAWPVNGGAVVKDAIEALGVPHTEVDLILVNGVSVGFDYPLQDGDRVSVYPMFESIDITPILRVRPHPLRRARFVLDTHLGKLATYLRLLGFDTLYRNDYGDEELARVSHSEGRILLTKDRGLLKRNLVTHGYCVRSSEPREQVVEVLRRFDLAGHIRCFARCLRCNGLLEEVPKEKVLHLLQPKTAKYYDEFYRCCACGRIYWPGTHHQRMRAFVDWVLAETSPDQRPT